MKVFVGGVHAVGKTFTLGPVCKALDLKHATASQLIREHKGCANWTETRQVSSIDENQRVLIAAMKQFERDGEKLVLDGHFVLRKSPKIHEEIKIEVFRELGLNALILLEAPSKIVFDRLQARHDLTWTLSEVEQFAQKEAKHAVTVSIALGIPLARLVQPSAQEIDDLMSGCFSA